MKKFTVYIFLLICLLSFSAASHATPINLIKNCGFEDFNSNKKSSNWINDAWKPTSTIGITEKKPFANMYCAFIQSDEDNDARIIQTVPVEPNTTYRFSGWVATENVTEGRIGANLCLMSGFIHSASVSGTQDWQQVDLYFKTGPNQKETTIGVRLGYYSNTVGGIAYFDRLEMTKVTDKTIAFQTVDDATINYKISNQNEKPDIKTPTPPMNTFSAKAGKLSSKIFSYTTLIIIFYLIAFGALFIFPKRTVNASKWLLALVALSFIARIALLPQSPFAGDLYCFKTWSLKLADFGIFDFYKSGFGDYPPFSLLIYWIVGILAKLFSVTNNEILFNSFVKLPAFVFDMGTALLIFNMLKRKNSNLALFLSSLYMFLPAVIYNSAYWGQADSLYTFFLVLTFYFSINNKYNYAIFALVAAFLSKTQTIAFIPVFILFFILRTTIKEQIKLVGTALLTFMVIFLPFIIKMPFNWLTTFYTSQANSFPYATLNTGNLMLLFNGNFVNDSTIVLPFISYNTLGIALFSLGIAFSCYYYFRKRTTGAFAAAMALSALVFFMTFPRVHERYLFPMFAFALLAVGYYKDKRLYFATLILSLSYLFNMHAVVLQYQKLLGDPAFTRVLYMCAITNILMLIFIFFLMRIRLSKTRSNIRAFINNYKHKLNNNLFNKLTMSPFVLVKKDYIAISIIALIYCIHIFVNLGSINTPQTGITLQSPQDKIIVAFPNPIHVSKITWYDAEGTGDILVEKFEKGKWSSLSTLGCGDYYALKQNTISGDAVEKIRIMPKAGAAGHVNEIALFDSNNSLIPLSQSNSPLFDEQQKMLVNPSCMNSTYFDEIYHGRTAYEFVKGTQVYETTHPPLGKDILSVGILMFGMNSFGMRFMHAVAGVLLIIMLFFLGREILATRFGAYSTMMLGFLDFMPFAQSRYASIDTFSVLFIVLMYIFTFKFIRCNKEDKKATWTLLGSIMLFFALAVAVKWTAVYGFVGVVLCIAIATPREKAVKTLSKALILFLVIVPIIYYLSYIPVLNCAHKSPLSMDGVTQVFRSQYDMYDYHTKLKATHPFQSSWWSWPYNFKPLWLYPDKQIPVAPGNKASIVSFGNPAIWLMCLAAFFILIYKLLIARQLSIMHLALIGFLSLYLPWILVTRAAYIYHFYPCLPFYLIFLSFVLEPLWEAKDDGREYIYTFFALCFILLILFYPVLTGIEISQNYINRLHWFPQDWIF